MRNYTIQELACDGVTDCSNGRDEDGCLSIYPENTDIRNFKPAYSDPTGWSEYLSITDNFDFWGGLLIDHKEMALFMARFDLKALPLPTLHPRLLGDRLLFP